MRCRCRAEGLGYLFWEEILRKRRRGWEEGDRRGGKAGPGGFSGPAATVGEWAPAC